MKKIPLPLIWLFFLCLATPVRSQKPQQSGTAVSWSAQTLQPAQLPDTVELFNPMSGFYTSLGQNPGKFNNYDLHLDYVSPKFSVIAPLSGAPVNLYGRVSWHSLEPIEGNYDFSIIDNVLAPCAPAQVTVCLPPGGAFSFRIMAFNSQVPGSTNITTGTDGYPVYSDLPLYLMAGYNSDPPTGIQHGWLLPVDPNDATQGHYFIPDWNDPFFLERLNALLSALGQRYDGDNRIGWIDIGLYGTWGEWHTQGLVDEADYTDGIPYVSTAPYYSLNTKAFLANKGVAGAYQAGTSPTKNFIIDAHVNAFQHTQLVSMTADGEGLCHALYLPGSDTHIGLRRDSLGSGPTLWFFRFPDKFLGCDTAADVNTILTRWQTAPFVTESAMNGPVKTGACQTFDIDPATGQVYWNEEIQEFHIALIKNQSCSGTWDLVSPADQLIFLSAGLQGGYRFAPVQVFIPASMSSGSPQNISLYTSWANTGVTPSYNAWRVEFSLWFLNHSGAPAQEFRRFTSQVDLRTILPTASNSPTVIQDTFTLQGAPPGQYELEMRVFDPRGYLQPMQLALQNQALGGYYPLGTVTISPAD
jgi:hypothetical protein